MRKGNEGIQQVSQKLKVLGDELKRKAVSLRGDEIDFSKIASSHAREGNLNGQSINRVIFYLRGFGCAWSLSEGGGCFMCGHFVGTSFGQKISPASFVGQFRDEFLRYDYSQFPMVCVYNAGSFFNEEEMPSEARKEIYRIIAKEEGIKSVIFESRPEFISLSLLREIEENLGGKSVEIGIGLETADDLVREVCVNKGFTLDEYRKCAALFTESSVKLLTYVTVKPLFLTTKEAIETAVATARIAVQSGSDIISLEPISLQSGTLVEHFYDKGLYSLPWGWDVIEVVRQIHDLEALIRIGGFEFYPIPKAFVHNCAACNKKLYDAISEYNRLRNLSCFEKVECNCKVEWQENMLCEGGATIQRLEERVELMLAS